MNNMLPQKPAEVSEHRLIHAIMTGEYPIDSNLPAERELAALIGVTRPTLRETLQRLARDGWLEIRHGKPTRVRDYWREGNLGVLAAIARYPDNLASDFPVNLLALRSLLAPAYTQQAIEQAASAVVQLLAPLQNLDDDPQVFTQHDWNLQLELTMLSGNPVFTLIYNSFAGLYQLLGLEYFRHAEYRALSQRFYRNLLRYAESGDAVGAGKLVRETMQSSQMLWQGLTQ